MSEEDNQKTHVIKADDQEDGTIRISHPFNPNSELYYSPLSDRVGMQRSQLAKGRIPPGKESFELHSHRVQEEFIFILEGKGELEIGEEKIELGPGDYAGFPCDGLAHNLANIGNVDLVYLMGGERSELEIAEFPRQGKIMVAGKDSLTLFDKDKGETYSLEAWRKLATKGD